MLQETNKPEIFKYSDAVSFLKDSFAAIRTRNPRFSMRAWARDLNLGDPATLAQILRGKRPLPGHYVPNLAEGLDLKPSEQKYLEALVGARNAKSPTERAMWTRHGQALLFKAAYRVDYLNEKEFEFLTDPDLHVLLNLIDVDGFRPDAGWILDHLPEKIDAERVREAYGLFCHLGILRKDGEGNYVRTKKHVSSRHDSASLAVKKFHENSLRKASRALYEQDVEEREFGSYLVAIGEDDLPRIKRQIRNFTATLLARCADAKSPKDRVYHLNVGFFAGSSRSRKK